MALLNPLDVARRLAALAGFFALIALALMLLWRVYVHHVEAVPYEQDEPVTVRMDVRSTTFVNFANQLS
jgi:hypothetical protein